MEQHFFKLRCTEQPKQASIYQVDRNVAYRIYLKFNFRKELCNCYVVKVVLLGYFQMFWCSLSHKTGRNKRQNINTHEKACPTPATATQNMAAARHPYMHLTLTTGQFRLNYAGCMVKKKNFLELQAPIICQCLLRTFSTFSGLGKTTLVGISRLITMQQACLMVQGHWRGLSVPFMQFCKLNFRPQCLDDVYMYMNELHRILFKK